jgi:signal transduction histidine kinase
MLNRNAEELFGKSIYTLLYYPIQTVISEQSFKELFTAILKGQVASHSIDIDIFSQAKSEVRNFEVSCSTVSSKNDISSGIVIVLEDVTKARESDRMKSEFIAIAAHELNTPLTSILGYTELLIDEEHVDRISEEQRRGYLETIYTKGEHLNRLVDDLLYLSHFESGRVMLLEKSQCQIEDLVKTVIICYRRENPDWTFDLSFSDDDIMIEVDVSKIGQIIENLLNNAIKYSGESRLIIIKGRRTGHWYQIDIEDSGIGMSPDELSHVFEKFYRAHPAMSAIAGLGLGMTIVKNIIEAHMGKIWLESEKGQGTVVSFVLPISKNKSELDATDDL